MRSGFVTGTQVERICADKIHGCNTKPERDMSSSSRTETVGRSESARGFSLLFAGLFILFLATKFLLFSSGILDRPAPGSVMFRFFDLIGIL